MDTPNLDINTTPKSKPELKPLSRQKITLPKLIMDISSWSWHVWLALIMPAIIIAGMVYAFSQMPPSSNTIPYSGEMILGGVVLVTLMFPLLFAVYRTRLTAKYVRNLGHQSTYVKEQWLDLSSNRYAIPLSLLVSTILLVSGGVLYWDASYGFPGFGKSWLTVGNFVAFPSSVVEWGFFGAIIYILQDMLRRYSALDLTPRFYFLSTIRIILAITASLLLFSLVQAGPSPLVKLYFREFGTKFEIAAPADGSNPNTLFWLLLLSFTAGMFPVKTIASITTVVGNWLSERLSKLPMGIGPFFKSTKDYNIPLSYLVTSEVGERFREEGIYNVQDFAASEIKELARRTPYNIAKLIDWQDRAMLLSMLGKTNLDTADNDSPSILDILIQNGYSRFSDLYYLHQQAQDTQYLTQLKQQFKCPLLLDTLALKGSAIAEKINVSQNKDVRLAALQVWYLSPEEIVTAFAEAEKDELKSSLKSF